MLFRRMTMRALFGAIAAIVFGRANAESDALQNGTFRDSMIALLARRHPEWHAASGTDSQSIAIGDKNIFLGNLYLHVKTMSDSAREEAILSFIDDSVNARSNIASVDKESFATARERLRLQIVPASYLKTADDLVHRPFPADLIIAYALDSERGYQLLQRPVLDNWHVGQEEFEKQAIENLEASSTPIELEPDPNRQGGAFVTVDMKDGYDAARLLLPQFMRRMRAALNAPLVCAGIPNRDFLVVWTPDFYPRRAFANKIAEDARNRPHPLTDALFVSAESGVRLANATEMKDHGR